MTQPWVIYGSGSSARGLLEGAVGAGVPVVLAGRNEPRVARLGVEFGVPARAVPVDSPRMLDLLEAAQGVVNTAGPFEVTAAPLRRAALRCRAHYVDLSNEWRTHATAFAASEAASRQRIAIIPGSGFGTYAAEALAQRLLTRVDGAHTLSLALWNRNGSSTPARKASTRRILAEYPAQRRDGRLTSVGDGAAIRRSVQTIGSKTIVPITDGNLFALTRTTTVPDICVFATTGMPSGLARAAIPVARKILRSAPNWGHGRHRGGHPVERGPVRLLGSVSKGREAAMSALTIADSIGFTARTVLAVLRRLSIERTLGTHTTYELLGDQVIVESPDIVEFADLPCAASIR